MNGKDLQGLQEAYAQVHQSSELLNELDSGFVGFRVGQGKKALRLGGSAGGFGGEVEVGTAKAKDTDAAAKAEVTNAVADVKNQRRAADIASNDAKTVAAKPTQSSAIKPGAKGASALGGTLSLSSAQKDAINAPKPEAQAAKVSVPQQKTVGYAAGNVGGSARVGSTPKPPATPTSTKPEAPKTPDVKRPAEVKTPDIRRPVGMDRGPDMVRKPESFEKPKFEDPRRKMMMGGGDMGRGMREQLAYYQLLNYLIGEGYASTEESADKIILNMSESWYSSIMEEVSLGK